MPRCFVIQPFDKGKYDKRYRDVLSPAIIKAGYDPYRVDHDDAADDLLEAINDNVRESAVVLADISEDNPNVWFEVGCAIAYQKDIVLICSSQRNKFPFDVSHRKIISYETESSSDYEVLSGQIVARLSAISSKQSEVRIVANITAPIAGLDQIELLCFACIVENCRTPLEAAHPEWCQNDMQASGLNKLGINLALMGLQSKGFVVFENAGTNGAQYVSGIRVTELGWTWMNSNRSQFVLQNKVDQPSSSEDSYDPFADE